MDMAILVKNRVYNLIRDDDKNDLAANIFDDFIITLIIINVILVIMDTFNLPETVERISYGIEVFSVIIFTIEYLLRLWTSDYIYSDNNKFIARVRYVFSLMALVDLFAILPFYIPFIIPVDLRVLRTVRIIRLFRLLKVNRYTNALNSIWSVFKNKASQLLSSLFIIFLLMIIASVLMYNVENPVQPEMFRNAFSGLWWAVATVTTVGYGDIYPVTIFGKILSSIIAVLGIALIAIPTGIISAGFIELITKPEKKEEQVYCPHCGKKLNDVVLKK